MKIVYIGNYSQEHCTEVHIAASLEDIGHEVKRVQEMPTLTTNDFSDIADYQLLLWTRTSDLSTDAMPEILELCRQKGVTTASYHLDLYVGLRREDGLDFDPFWRTDFVFTPDGSEQAANVFKAKNIHHYYMKPGVYKPECYIAQKLQPFSYQHNIIFVGGGAPTGQSNQYGHPEWPYRGELLAFLRDNYADNFEKFGHPQETIRNAPLNQLYADTKIVIGDSLCLNFDHPYYWSDRVYETLGRGGFIIHPYIKGLEEEFTDSENIVFYEYNDWNGLQEKIDYYLEHDDEREKIRLAGHNFVKENCTYNNRLRQMMNTIASVKHGQPMVSMTIKDIQDAKSIN